MIPYDDLVVALAGWRARQGLPVEQLAAPIIATASPAPVPASKPPPPPRGFTTKPPPLAPPDDEFAVEDAALIDEAHYENEGDDFAMGFGQVQGEDEATSIGASPARDSFGGGTQPEPRPAPAAKRARNNDDW